MSRAHCRARPHFCCSNLFYLPVKGLDGDRLPAFAMRDLMVSALPLCSPLARVLAAVTATD